MRSCWLLGLCVVVCHGSAGDAFDSAFRELGRLYRACGRVCVVDTYTTCIELPVEVQEVDLCTLRKRVHELVGQWVAADMQVGDYCALLDAYTHVKPNRRDREMMALEEKYDAMHKTEDVKRWTGLAVQWERRSEAFRDLVVLRKMYGQKYPEEFRTRVLAMRPRAGKTAVSRVFTTAQEIQAFNEAKLRTQPKQEGSSR